MYFDVERCTDPVNIKRESNIPPIISRAHIYIELLLDAQCKNTVQSSRIITEKVSETVIKLDFNMKLEVNKDRRRLFPVTL
ncbi:hypothetical protein XELAEV_18028681mg [Xenopus laevis]|uniref:Uncharacterized protein n=1 Tax=Xenopus laevis TaxID=8355 RepID=A0A974CQ71_XENLA|nr:hypothetical protein XELAEV_18028681mg [Xenopus laevis]